MSRTRKALSAASLVIAAAVGYGTANLTAPTLPQRPMLLQLRADLEELGVWAPATEGLWLFSPIVEIADGRLVVSEAKMLLIRGLGARLDDALAAPVVTVSDELVVNDTAKSIRELAAGYWTFVRPLQEGDPPLR